MAFDTELEEQTITELKEPNLWRVVLINDDTTPVDFVISLLLEVFHHDVDSAVHITTLVHEEGSGIAGVYDFDIAEAKAVESTNLARGAGYPLQLKIIEE
jgi:ATP-dependent Clp protease adaptor protein ClpS